MTVLLILLHRLEGAYALPPRRAPTLWREELETKRNKDQLPGGEIGRKTGQFPHDDAENLDEKNDEEELHDRSGHRGGGGADKGQGDQNERPTHHLEHGRVIGGRRVEDAQTHQHHADEAEHEDVATLKTRSRHAHQNYAVVFQRHFPEEVNGGATHETGHAERVGDGDGAHGGVAGLHPAIEERIDDYRFIT